MSGLRVFVVDDDRDFAESLAEVIEARGHHVELAYSGEEASAIEALRKASVVGCFMKPFDPGEILDSIESAITRGAPDR